jgi:tryptophan synthase alpha chain
MSESVGADAITKAIADASGPAICAYLTAGYPDDSTFIEALRSVAATADLVEVGVPFTDPMADGLTIQRASHVALERGVTLGGILEMMEDERVNLPAPHLLMGYYNPFLVGGLGQLATSLANAGTSGVIVPDLPVEESGPLRQVLDPEGLAVVQLVTPSTPQIRLQRLVDASRGFVYAVTMKGVTGGRLGLRAEDLEYLERVRRVSALPVLAGFGIRHPDDVAELAPFVDGVVVGSALIDAIDRGEDPGAFVQALRPAGVTT